MRKTACVLVVAVAGLLAVACGDVLGPGRELVGTWSSADATLAASWSGADLFIPCIAAHFGPIVTDSVGRFQATGAITSAVGLVIARPGDPLTLSGRRIGDRIVIPWPWIVADSGADTLSPGGGTVHVCNA